MRALLKSSKNSKHRSEITFKSIIGTVTSRYRYDDEDYNALNLSERTNEAALIFLK
jgi:hypothetical protein